MQSRQMKQTTMWINATIVMVFDSCDFLICLNMTTKDYSFFKETYGSTRNDIILPDLVTFPFFISNIRKQSVLPIHVLS